MKGMDKRIPHFLHFGEHRFPSFLAGHLDSSSPALNLNGIVRSQCMLCSFADSGEKQTTEYELRCPLLRSA